MTRPTFLFAFVVGLSIGAALDAQTVRDVPSQFPTIQAAINASANGDIVRVAPGTYLENIDFLGKGITVRSTGGAAVTTIDGRQLAPVVRMITYEPDSTILDGFTITHGLGGAFQPNAFTTPRISEAGGIDMRGASPTIIRCIITQNTGGSAPGPLQNVPMLTRSGAGGVHLSSNARLIDCVVTNNIGGTGASQLVQVPAFASIGGNGSAGGVATTFDSEAPIILGCTIDGNTGGNAGFSVAPLAPNGGFGTTGPGGVWLESSVQAVVGIVNTRITNNHAGSGGGGETAVGGVYATKAYFGDCLIAKNTGGAIASGAILGAGAGGVFTTNATFDHCTIVENIGGGSVSSTLGTGAMQTGTNVIVTNAIFWGNKNAVGAMSNFLVPPTLTNAIVEGGAAGANVSSANPLFVSASTGDFSLGSGSPAIDARPLPFDIFELPAHDLAGAPRWLGAAPDYGAFESGNFDAQKIGSNDDFALFARPIGIGSPSALDKDIYGGMTLGVTMLSQGGTTANRYPVLVADLFSEGFPPTPVSYAFPELHWGANGFVAFDGTLTNQTMTPPPLLAYPIPFGLTGIVVRLQGAIYEPRAKNGFFAVTDAMDIHIR